MGHDCRGGRCVVLGNGGVARTLGFTLALRQLPESLTLVGRSAERVGALATEITERTGYAVRWVTFGSDEFVDIMSECTLCVNCTSVGMHPNEDSSPLPRKVLRPDLTVLDTVYNPSKTLLVRQAEEAGCRVQNGLRMLVYQGLASFKLWTEEDAVDMDGLRAAVAES
jgi:shikimate dehydrogenase